ncbi:MAG TPA: hypothetical protein VLJ39_22460, partial [Tepidisphaeraceae bacterium]|nr:hypothetical protein [Tepidisphaeraceae bacterium]
DRRLHEHAREVSTLFWPMVILAIMTMLAGNWLGVRDMLESSVAEARQMVQIQAQTSRDFHGRAAHAFEAVWSSYEAPDEEDRHDESAGAGSDATATALLRGKQLATRWAALLSLAGAAIAIALYAPGPGLATRIVRLPPINWINAWLTSGMYFDELYAALFVTIPLWMAAGLDWFDRAVVDRLTRILSFTSRG